MTLRIGNKTWARRHSGTLLAEGEELVNNQSVKVAELIRYGRRAKSHMEVDESIADDKAWQEVIDSVESWQKAIVGIVVNGPDSFSLEPLEWCAYSAPHNAFLTITMLLKDRELPIDWIENAISCAHYSVHSFERIVYQICNEYVDKDTIKRWLLSVDSPCWRVAGICACARQPELDSSFRILAAKAYVHLRGGRFDSMWLKGVTYAALFPEIRSCATTNARFEILSNGSKYAGYFPKGEPYETILKILS